MFEPGKIFEHVELKTGTAGFAGQRRQAEDAVAPSGAYVLDDIYIELGRRNGWSTEVLERLKQAEIDAEIDHVIPIADNLAKVRDGDILVSDMYLGETVIRHLLQKAGFDKKVGLYVSSHGKASGSVWPKILKDYRIVKHLGDNVRNDIEVPRACGIMVAHTAISAPNPIEVQLIKAGFRDLALLCREVRLTTPSQDHVTRELMDIQTSLNFSMLLMASIPLAQFVQQCGIEQVLFSSRDSELWMKLLRRLAPKIGLRCEIEYFYTCRLARRFPSPDYLAYARDRLSAKTLLVDLCGTGWSVAHLFQNLGFEKLPAFMLLHMPKFGLYEKSAPTPNTCEFYSAIKPEDRGGLHSAFIELANAAPYASIVDVKRIESAVVPVLDIDSRHPAQIELVRTQVRVFDALIEAMDRYDLSGVVAIDDKVASGNVATFARLVGDQTILRNLFLTTAEDDDADVCRRLGCPEFYPNKP